MVWGSPNRFGDPHTKMGMRVARIPISVWGSQNRFGDPRTKTGIPEYPYQNEDPQTNMGMKTLTDLGIPIPKRGSPNLHTKTGIPEPIWGCKSNESPNRFGDPQTKTGISESPYQNGDPQTNMGIVQSLTHTNMGFIPIWGPTELTPKLEIPKLEGHSKWGPHIGMGIPISVWVGICQYSKSGSPHTNMGFILIWGPTYLSPPRSRAPPSLIYLYLFLRRGRPSFWGRASSLKIARTSQDEIDAQQPELRTWYRIVIPGRQS